MSKPRLIFAIMFSLFLAVFMLALLTYNSLPTICGVGPEIWGRFAEWILFAPTIWATLPLNRVLILYELFGLRTIITLAEVAFLASLYGVLVYALTGGREGLGRLKRRVAAGKWLWLGAFVFLVLISVGGRIVSAQKDVASEFTMAAGSTIEVVAPAAATAGQVVVASSETFELEEEVLECSWMPMPNQTPVLACLPYQDTGGMFSGKGAEIFLYEPSGPGSVSGPRAISDASSGGFSQFDQGLPSQVALSTLAVWSDPVTNDKKVVRLGTFEDVAPFVPYLSPAMAHDVGDAVLVTGLGFTAGEKAESEADRLQLFQNPMWAKRSVEIWRLSKAARSKPTLIGDIPSFSDHGYRTIDSLLTSDGLLHFGGIGVLMSSNNRSRGYHLQFDTKNNVWLKPEILFSRDTFTSTSRIAIAAREDGALWAFWALHGGADVQPGDGVYAYRLGSRKATHLLPFTEERSSEEFSYLIDADETGRMVLAISDWSREVRWFLSEGDTWQFAGSTRLSDKVYPSTDNHQPVVLWPGSRPGTIRLAVAGLRTVQLQEIELPPVKE